MNSLESLNTVFNNHIGLLKQLAALSVSDIKKGIFNKKYFWKFYKYELSGYNDAVFMQRMIDEFLYDPKFSKTEKEYSIHQLKNKLTELEGRNFIDIPAFLNSKSRVQFAEEKYMDLGHAVFQLMWDEEVKGNPKIENFFSEILKIEGWQKPVFIMENIQVLPKRIQIEAAKGFKRQIKRKLSYKLCYPIIDTNYFLMRTSKEDFERIINRESYYEKIENDILEICTRIIERKHTKKIENLLNDDLTDHLRSKGYIVTDQTRSGKSSTGKSAGSIDIMIRDQKQLPITIIEALRLKNVGKKNKVLDEHLFKLIHNYDSTGLTIKYLIVYVEAKEFQAFCSTYSFYINSKHSKRSKKIQFDSVGLTKEPYGSTLLGLKTIDSFIRLSGKYIKIKHILIDMSLENK